MNFAEMSTAEQRTILLSIKSALYYMQLGKRDLADIVLSWQSINPELLQQVIDHESIWKGYQRYNSLMREYGESDYRYLNQTEVQAIRQQIIDLKAKLA